MKMRIFFHPILEHQRSRLILGWFVAIALIFGATMWWEVHYIFKSAGLTPNTEAVKSDLLARILFSVTFKFVLIFGIAFLAAVLTSQKTVGPVKRIDQWLEDWLNGYDVPPLKLRTSDRFHQFSKLIKLINDFRQKTLSQ